MMLLFAAGFVCGVVAIIVLLLYELSLFFGPRSPRESDVIEAKVIAVIVGALLLIGGAVAYRSHVYDLGYTAAVNERQASDLKAIAVREKENAVAVKENTAINTTVTKDKDEKLTPVIRTIYVDRVRVGTAICPAAGPTKTDDASGGDQADSGTRLVSPQVEERIRELDAEVEGHLATGRACQDWGRKHGFIE